MSLPRPLFVTTLLATIALVAGCPVGLSDAECMAILEGCLDSSAEIDDPVEAICECAREVARGLNGGCCAHPWGDQLNIDGLTRCTYAEQLAEDLMILCEGGCLVNRDCDDALFCNGAEVCIDNQCVSGQNPCEVEEECNEEQEQCEGGVGDMLVSLANNSPSFNVDVTLFYHNDDDIPDALLTEIGTERNLTIGPGAKASFREYCDNLQAIVIDDADLVVVGALGPETSSEVLHVDEHFECGSEIVFTFTHPDVIFDFDVTVEVY